MTLPDAEIILSDHNLSGDPNGGYDSVNLTDVYRQLTDHEERITDLESSGGLVVRLAPTFIGSTSGSYFNGGDLLPGLPSGVMAGDTLVVIASYRGGEPSFDTEDQPIMVGGTQVWSGIHQPSTTQYVMHAVYNGTPSLGTLPDPGWWNILNWVVLAFRGVEDVEVLHHGLRGFSGPLEIADGSVVFGAQTFFDTAGGFTAPPDWTQTSQEGYAGLFTAFRRFSLRPTVSPELDALTSNPNGYDHICILNLLGVLGPFNPHDVYQHIDDVHVRLDQLESGGGGELAYPIGMELIDPSSSVDPALGDPFPAIQSGNVPLVVREYGGPEAGFVHHLRLFAPEEAGLQLAALLQLLPNTLLPNGATNGEILRMQGGVWERADQYMEIPLHFAAAGSQIYVASRDVYLDSVQTFGAGSAEFALWDADTTGWVSLGAALPESMPAGLAMQITVTGGALAINIAGRYKEIVSIT